jgi:hypothetical protein
MPERLTELNTEFKAQHGVTLAIRVGVDTREVIAASDQNVVTRDAVNVAARLKQMAESGNDPNRRANLTRPPATASSASRNRAKSVATPRRSRYGGSSACAVE